MERERRNAAKYRATDEKVESHAPNKQKRATACKYQKNIRIAARSTGTSAPVDD
jgi:hypothetical protein